MAPKNPAKSRATIEDDRRFAKIKTDPRFRTLKSKKRQKQPIADARFAGISLPPPIPFAASFIGALEDPDFQETPQTPIDKYGREVGRIAQTSIP